MYVRLQAVLGLIVVLTAGMASAAEDFSGQDLEKREFIDRNLEGANFEDAKLIIGMNGGSPSVAGRLLGGDARHFAPTIVDKQAAALEISLKDSHRSIGCEVAKALLRLANEQLRLHAISDVGTNADKVRGRLAVVG